MKSENKLSKKIEEAEISHMRTDHIFENINNYAEKIMQKLKRIQTRIETLTGDCMILAASVCYLGGFSVTDRNLLRKEMSETL
jgi:hypothetical protein